MKQIPIEGTGHSHPYLNLSQGIETSRGGPAELVRPAGRETPLALASADLNEDGIPDLVTAWSTETGGVIKIHLGNPEGFGGGLTEAEAGQSDSFFPGRLAANVPEVPLLVETGDFTGDGHQDVLCTRHGSTQLWLLAGDGNGNVLPAREIKIPGSITAFQVGQINRHDGLDDVMLGVSMAAGAHLLVFDSATGGLEAQPETISVPSPVTEIAVGNVIGSVWADVVGVAEKDLIVIAGRDLSAAVAPAQVEIKTFPEVLTSVAVGNFTGGHALDVAVLDTAGLLHILNGDVASHSMKASIQEGAGSLGNWRDETRFLGSQVAQLTVANMSSLPYADLLATDITSRMHVVTASSEQKFEPIELTTFDQVVDVLPLKINGDGLEDLVVLQTGDVPLMRLVTLPMATFSVNSTGNGADSNTADGVCNDGSGNCTLRAAIQQANASSGADVINFAIAGAGPHTIAPTGSTNLPSIQETLTINGYSQSGASRNTLSIGDNAVLRIELNGTGAGPASRGLQVDASNCVISGLVIN
ncbi:MAG TPA: VCBS repeat-containing protein, partial [Acidobacteriota bacterium]|nr:VCBS repeat-containing protein [Acidobacteriota bacterium]